MFDFLRWVFETQLVIEKAEVWQAFFMNFITVVVVLVYCSLVLYSATIPTGFEVMVGLVLGFYFKGKAKS
jgi:uncharacterized membrane protein